MLLNIFQTVMNGTIQNFAAPANEHRASDSLINSEIFLAFPLGILACKIIHILYLAGQRVYTPHASAPRVTFQQRIHLHDEIMQRAHYEYNLNRLNQEDDLNRLLRRLEIDNALSRSEIARMEREDALSRRGTELLPQPNAENQIFQAEAEECRQSQLNDMRAREEHRQRVAEEAERNKSAGLSEEEALDEFMRNWDIQLEQELNQQRSTNTRDLTVRFFQQYDAFKSGLNNNTPEHIIDAKQSARPQAGVGN